MQPVVNASISAHAHEESARLKEFKHEVMQEVKTAMQAELNSKGSD